MDDRNLDQLLSIVADKPADAPAHLKERVRQAVRRQRARRRAIHVGIVTCIVIGSTILLMSRMEANETQPNPQQVAQGQSAREPNQEQSKQETLASQHDYPVMTPAPRELVDVEGHVAVKAVSRNSNVTVVWIYPTAENSVNR